MASTSHTESEAAFKKQAAHLGLSDEWIQGLVGINVNNMGMQAGLCLLSTRSACYRCRCQQVADGHWSSHGGDSWRHRHPQKIDLRGPDVRDIFGEIPG